MRVGYDMFIYTCLLAIASTLIINVAGATVAPNHCQAESTTVSHFCGGIQSSGSGGYLGSLPSSPLEDGKEPNCSCIMKTKTDGYVTATFIAAPKTSPENCESPLLIYGPLGLERFNCGEAKLSTLTMTLYTDQNIIFVLQNLRLLHQQVYCLRYDFISFDPHEDGDVELVCEQEPYVTHPPLTTPSTAPPIPTVDLPVQVPVTQPATQDNSTTVVTAVFGALCSVFVPIIFIMLSYYCYRKMKSQPGQQNVQPSISSVCAPTLSIPATPSHVTIITTTTSLSETLHQSDESLSSPTTCHQQDLKKAAEMAQTHLDSLQEINAHQLETIEKLPPFCNTLVERQRCLTEDSQIHGQVSPPVSAESSEKSNVQSIDQLGYVRDVISGYVRAPEMSSATSEDYNRSWHSEPDSYEDESCESSELNCEERPEAKVTTSTTRKTPGTITTPTDESVNVDEVTAFSKLVDELDVTVMDESIESISTNSGIKSEPDFKSKPMDHTLPNGSEEGNPDYVRVCSLGEIVVSTGSDSEMDGPYVHQIVLQ